MRIGRFATAVGLLSWALLLCSCDKLGMGEKKETSADKSDKSEKDSDESDESEESSKKKKKKKKKKSADDESDESEEASAKPTATATATAAPTATETAAPTATETAAPASGDVKRYQGEQADTGSLSINGPTEARKEADRRSELVIVLQAGNRVDKVARYGTYTLVTWKNKSGDKFGWIETIRTNTNNFKFDAGVTGLESVKRDAGF